MKTERKKERSEYMLYQDLRLIEAPVGSQVWKQWFYPFHSYSLFWRSDQNVAEVAAYTAPDKHKRKTSTPLAWIEPTNP
jgi:hypothetical protein